MSKSDSAATRGDIEDVLEVMQRFMTQVSDEFRSVREELEFAREDRADIRGAIAELSAQVRDYHNESVFLNHHVDKLTEAIKQIARETGVKLTVEI